MQFNSVNEILDYAIQNEQDAADFYTALADKMDSKSMQEVFRGFAAEEMGHKIKLMAVKDGKNMASSERKILDLKVGDHLVDIEMKPDFTYQEVLIVAMKAEKAAFKLYNDLADACDDANAMVLFLELAQEEAKHKLRFEIEYDDYILAEN